MRTFFFDLDGTLTDSRTGLLACFGAALESLGVSGIGEKALAAHLGTPLPMLFRAFRPDLSQASIARGIEVFRAAYEREGIFENELYPGIRDMLRTLREARRDSWIVTSKPTPYAEQVVDILHIRNLVAGIVGAGLDETDTKTGLTARALRAAAAAPAETVMLGDRHHDVTGARDNGVKPVGALWGYGTRDEMARAGCRAFAVSPDDFRRRYAV